MNRIPRPIGTTNLAYKYNEEPSKDNKIKLRNHLIKNFLNEALYFPYPQSPLPEALQQRTTLQNKKTKSKKKLEKNTQEHTICYDIRTILFEDLARYLGLSMDRLQYRVEKVLSLEAKRNFKMVSKTDYQDLSRATTFRLLKKSLQGLNRAEDWTEELMAVARAMNYRPGNIMATNQALTNEISWMKSAGEQLKALNQPIMGTLPAYQKNTQINNYGQPGSQNPTQGSQFLTPTMAVRLLEEKGITTEALDLDLIGLTNGIFDENMPNVEALSTDAQGTRGVNPKDLIALATEASKPLKHDTRREEEYGDIEEIL